MNTTNDSLISSAKVAEMYDVNEKTVDRWADAGRIPRAVVSQPRFKRWSRNAVLADIERIKSGELQEATS